MRFTGFLVTSILTLGTLACGTETTETTASLQAEDVSVRLEGTHKLPIFDGPVTSSIYIASSTSGQLEGSRAAILKQITVPNDNGFRKTAVPGTYKVQLKAGQFLHTGSYDAFFDRGSNRLRENWIHNAIEVQNDQLIVREANTLAGTNTQNAPLNAGKEWAIVSPLGSFGIIQIRYLGKRTIEVTIPQYSTPLEF